MMSSIVMFAVASPEVLIVMVLSEATLESRLVKVGSLSPMVLLFWETVCPLSEALTMTSPSSIYQVAA